MNNAVNVDQEEVNKFEAMAARWWDPTGDFRPLHDLNPVRRDYILKHTGPLKGKRVLDVGCGGGLLTEALARTGAQVTGIDMAEAPLKVARLHALESDLSIAYERRSAEDLAAERPSSWDVVTCLEMLEHVPDPASVVRACAEMAAPGGWVFFSTLNRHPKAYVLAILGAEYVLRLLPRGTHDYEKFIKPSELVRAAREAGLNPVEAMGLKYNPLAKRAWLDADDLDVNYLLVCRRPA
jgi:2-polyprenyl-6-hydroxyphenyl methylase/3-demethylubiquinone-9 3-methyltransferase